MLSVDLTADEDISQEDFKKRCKRLVLGEDAQIMRRYLKLRMSFTHAPIPKVPQFSVSFEDISAIHARFDEDYYNIPQKIITPTVDEEVATGDETLMSENNDSYEDEPDIEEGGDSQQNKTKYSYTQGAEDIDNFFGSSSSVTSDVANTAKGEALPAKSRKRSREMLKSRPSKRASAVEAKSVFKRKK